MCRILWHEDHKHDAGEVDTGHQLAQREQRAEAVFADGEGNRAECANGGQAHDHVDHSEHALHQAIKRVDEEFCAGANLCQGDAQQHREQ